MPPFNLPSLLDPEDRTAISVVVREEGEYGPSDACSSSSSSIGKNSDDEESEKENEEVESKLNNTSFDSAVDALEQALPNRGGISKHYNGKSKSFASLADAACLSIKDLAKPENAYSRKRKNLLAYSLLYNKGRTSMLMGPRIGGGIAKRPMSSSRSTLALGVANNQESPIDENGLTPETNGGNNSCCASLSPPLPPLPQPPWRSFSLADLQHCAVSASAVNPNLPPPLMGKRTKPDEVS